MRYKPIIFNILCVFIFDTIYAKIPSKSALVIEYTKGKTKILYQSCANEQRHPASLTKMMTVYLLLNAIQNKKVTLNTKFKVSNFAAMQMPSKLNLKPGELISVENCLKALLVKSANDVAVVVAEGLSGSVKNFCQQMNNTAKKLGMSTTHFENPSGVPNPKQITSATDIAKLGTKLYTSFPKYWYLFGLKNFNYHKKNNPTHCKILEWYKGADGAKTGFICASGYNLWVTAQRFNKQGESKRLMVIVFGGDSGKKRDFYAAKLLNEHFKGYNLTNNSSFANNITTSSITTGSITTKKSKNNTSNNIISSNATSNNVTGNNVTNKNINNDPIYELDSVSIDDIIESSGRSKQFFDNLYKYDVESVESCSELEIDFSKKHLNKPFKCNNKSNNKLSKRNIKSKKTNKITKRSRKRH